MALFRGIGNAFGTVGGALAAPFDGGKCLKDQARKTKKEFKKVGGDIDDAFSKDGCVTQFVEHIPLAGYAASALHAAHGHDSHAKRAAARCTKTTVAAGAVAVCPASAGLAGGAFAGGAGAAAGKGVQCGIEATYSEKDKRAVGQEALNSKAGGWLLDIGVGAGVGAASGALRSSGQASSAARGAPARATPASSRAADAALTKRLEGMGVPRKDAQGWMGPDTRPRSNAVYAPY